MNRIAFEVLRRLHDSLDVEVTVKGVGSDDFMRHVCKSDGSDKRSSRPWMMAASMPRSRRVRRMRSAISPRLAMRTRLKAMGMGRNIPSMMPSVHRGLNQRTERAIRTDADEHT